MIELTIDGQEIKVPPGISVLEAAHRKGIDIPHMCYHPELSISGGCRLCIVEVEGYTYPVPSCGMACQDGMVVQTRTPKIDE